MPSDSNQKTALVDPKRSAPEKSPEDIFECRQCGECCNGYGGTYITPKDIAAIAEFIGSDPDRFVTEYCQMSGSRPVLAVGENGYCVFWKNKICTIHPVKPRMCRAWPFLESVVTDPDNWRVMSSMCPGIRTDASNGQIIRCVRRVVENRRETE
jgi:uncharacterized protein